MTAALAALFQGIPEKLIGALASHQQRLTGAPWTSLAAKMLLPLAADAPARNQSRGSFETIIVPGFGLRVLCPTQLQRGGPLIIR